MYTEKYILYVVCRAMWYHAPLEECTIQRLLQGPLVRVLATPALHTLLYHSHILLAVSLRLVLMCHQPSLLQPFHLPVQAILLDIQHIPQPHFLVRSYDL